MFFYDFAKYENTSMKKMKCVFLIPLIKTEYVSHVKKNTNIICSIILLIISNYFFWYEFSFYLNATLSQYKKIF